MARESSPTARALLALEAIQACPGITADALAARLGVSERAARRYVAVLREAGISVESLRGRFGGYRAGRGVRLPPLMFSATEALHLVMAVLDGHHDVRDGSGPVAGALGKIVRALPHGVATQVEALRLAAAPALDLAAVRPDPSTTAALVEACAERRRVRLRYRSDAGSEWDLDADPWAVVVRHGRWYLLCWSHRSGAVRTLRVDRVRSTTTLPDTFDPPADLDPVRMLEEHLAVGWEYDVDVLIDAEVDAVRQYLPRSLGRLEPSGGTATRLTGTTGNPYWYAEQLTVIPVGFEVVGGPELRQTTRRLGERLLAATGGGSGGDPGR
ncbi:helix-turn-helix transcriptional regulator [Cellulomonas phragmiteti]|uniref:Transcriptional regulator n=1 Tax=Cellulomonas phragmiteti TaxID=478780 RepID=A0ABQ4DIY2_9CELL|nr:WYL domain-containing protein [Cellulomonas phragmiteti]GIG39309.1 transcriptional regulator [Cellulomonas phragmiteti]